MKWEPHSGNVGALEVGPVIAFCHPMIKVLVNYVLHAEDNSVAKTLDVIMVGLGLEERGHKCLSI